MFTSRLQNFMRVQNGRLRVRKDLMPYLHPKNPFLDPLGIKVILIHYKTYNIMKLGLTRKFIVFGIIFASLSPSFLANIAHAQQKGFGSALVDNLGPFLVPFIILILAGFTLMIYNGSAIRKSICER